MNVINIRELNTKALKRPFFFIFWTLGSFLFTFASLGQIQSTNGNFQIAQAVGCAPFTVTPEVLFSGNISLIQYRYNNTLNPESCDLNYIENPQLCTNGDDTTDTTYTYNTPGTYYILQIIGTRGGNAEVDFIEITVLPPDIPTFDVSYCRNNVVVLDFDFSADQYDFYEIDFGDGTTINFDKTGSNTYSHTYAAQGQYDILVSGKLNTGDDINCGRSPAVSVNTLNNIPIPNLLSLVSSSSNSLRLTYDALDPNLDYQLQLNTGSGFQDYENVDPDQDPTELLITDNSFDNLNESYTFRLVASDPCGGEETSNQVSSIAVNYQLQPPITDQINVTYSWNTNEFTTPMEFIQNGNIIFTITAPDLSGSNTISYANCTEIGPFYIEKNIGGIIVRSLTLTPFQNQNLDLPAPNQPNGALIDNNVELTFDAPLFAFSSIAVYRKDGSGAFNIIGSTSDLNFNDFGVSGTLTEACYLIEYIDECGNRSLRSPEVCIPLDGLLRAPNAFSPNGDGINDTFDVGNGVFTNFRILIYNKWGNLVYHGTDPTNGWDGNVSGQEAPTGTYYYKISFVKSGLELINTGTVTLIR